jgi:Tfp pilus assembly protein PilN
LSIEIIMVGVGFLVGIFSGMEMNRAAQRFALEWRTTRRHATTAQEQRRSALILVLAVLFGVVVLPRVPVSFSTLLFLPFTAGLALTVLVSLAQKFLPLR